MMQFNQLNRPTDSHKPASIYEPRTAILVSWVAIVLFTFASTASMMLCPCDSVGLRNHHAISLVAVAMLLGLAAAWLIYRRMRRDTGATAFLRAFTAIVAAGVAIYAELFVAMQIVAWMARPR